MYIIKDFLNKAEINHILSNIKEGWQAGYTNAGKHHKDNYELIEQDCAEKIASKIKSDPIALTKLFIKRMTLPRFNLYKQNQYYKPHIDAFKQHGVQTDWSFTLMLHPATKGGDLKIEIDGETKTIEQEAGDLVVYPSGNVHQVTSVIEGQRIAAIGWIESLITSQEKRKILSNIVDVLEILEICGDKNIELLKLSYSYHNLMRLWSK